MYYSMIILLILVYSNYAGLHRVNRQRFLLRIFPVFLILFFTTAFQYNVGTDYFNYLSAGRETVTGLFKLRWFLIDREYLFAGIVKIAQLLDYPQMIFILTGLLHSLLVCLILREFAALGLPVSWTVFFYFSLTLCFFNQFNGIRQFVAVYMVVLAVLLAVQGKHLKAWVLILLSPFFHQSAWAMVCVFAVYELLNKKLRINKWGYFILCLLCLCLVSLDLNKIILNLAKATGYYSEYAHVSNTYAERMSFSGIFTKLLKLVVVFYSVCRLDIKKLTEKEYKLLLISFVSSLVMIMSFASSLVWRMYFYFDMFIMIPTILFFKYKATAYERVFITLYLAGILFIKIGIIPQGEYLYNSVLFSNMF